jgi:superfamily I DNA and/or RNA helicase
VRPFFLDLQFRAHPKLAEFSSEMIYGGRLRSGVTAQA